MHNTTDRPSKKSIFVEGEKRLEVYFYTSNVTKFLLARLVFDSVGLKLRHYSSHTEPYAEDYSVAKKHLLRKAVDQIVSRVGHTSLFFVEDTSLRVESLSNGSDSPGVAVKEWFSSKRFEDLDLELKSSGNNRLAIAKSDIALYIPNTDTLIHFHGETEGRIADTEPCFAASMQYPWLTTETFDAWFIPNSSTRRLGEMSIDEFWRFDFRIKALKDLLAYLEALALGLNLPPRCYAVRKSWTKPLEAALFPMQAPILIVVGRTCAGKTTLGEYVASRTGALFIEASSVLRMRSQRLSNGASSQFDIAKQLLDEGGPDVIARAIVDTLGDELGNGAVISGFRTIEELEFMRSAFPHTQVIHVEASERTRFERYILRAREGTTISFAQFREQDRAQWSFGLLRVAQDFANIKIRNEDSLADYYATIDSVLLDHSLPRHHVKFEVRPRCFSARNRLYRCLRVLSQSDTPLTTEEIEKLSMSTGKTILHNNVNKVLKAVPELAKRIEPAHGRIEYEITPAGRAYVRFMDDTGSNRHY